MHSRAHLAEGRRRWAFARAAAGTLPLLACAGLLAACGSSKGTVTNKAELDIARVEHSIEQSILTERHLSSTVVCPQFVSEEPGVTFECVATTASPTKKGVLIKTPFVVTVENKSGFVTYTGK